MDKYLSLDVGEVRIGVAISDTSKKFAFPYETIDRKKIKAIYRIKDIVREENVSKIIVGLPKRLNGENQIQVEKIEKFVEKLKKVLKIDIIYYDERFTTKLAETHLKNTNKSYKEMRKTVDMVAANIILENFLNEENKKNGG